MTPADLSKLRETKGCGESHGDAPYGPTITHDFALAWARTCSACLTLLMDAARAGTVEECIKAVGKVRDRRGDSNILNEIVSEIDRLLLNPPSATAKEPPAVKREGEKGRTE